VGALVVAKSGPRFKPSAGGEANTMDASGGPKASQLIAIGVSMELLAGHVGNRLRRVVVDRTGLSGRYNFTLN
jgi:uncharacterized protein (TIGR03435 family)